MFATAESRVMDHAIEQFLHRLDQSHLLSADEVSALWRTMGSAKSPQTVDDLGRMLVQSGRLTKYQVLAIYNGHGQRLILGEYIVLDKLGKGGMGVVFKARHRLMDRIVALKTLPTGTLKPDAVQRFYREVKAAARLSHPNIVTAFDAGEEGGIHYLVMELVEGHDLAAVVKEGGPLPLRQAIDYSLQSARGLEYAHQHGVVHRDVKPSNLLLSSEGTIKILDMGLARLNESMVNDPEAADLTGTGLIMGTIDYMSPEHAEDMRLADHRSDVYSLGCTLFYLLLCRPVFEAETVVKRVLAHREQPIPLLALRRPDCPDSLDAVFQRMLAKRPEDRYQSMAELIPDLEQCLSPVNASPPIGGATPLATAATGNWLDALDDPQPASGTDKTRLGEATVSSEDEDVFTAPPRLASGSSSIMRRGSGSSSILRRGSHVRHAKEHVVNPRQPWSKRAWIAMAVVATAMLVTSIGIAVGYWRSSGKKGATEKAAETTIANVPTPSDDVPKPPDKDSGAQIAAPATPPWKTAWADAVRRANSSIAAKKFGFAIRAYRKLSKEYNDPILEQKCGAAIAPIEDAADEALESVGLEVKQHLGRNEFTAARALLQQAVGNDEPARAAHRARDMLAEVALAEKRAVLQPATPAKLPEPPRESPELVRQRQLDAEYAAAMEPIEARVTAWDFHGAVSAVQSLHFNAPELVQRSTIRRQQIARLDDLKARMIAAINRAHPHLRKTDFGLKGFNGDLEKADDDAIATVLANGQNESQAWVDLTSKAVQNLEQLVIREEDGSDWLACGLLAVLERDLETAAKDFDKANSLGSDASSCQALLAAIDFTKARKLLAKKRFTEAIAALSALQEKFGKLPWYAANKVSLDAAVGEAHLGLREVDADKLFREAAAALAQHELFSLKPLVERLRSDFGDTSAARNAQVAEMEKAVAGLGKLIRVARDGSGDAKSLQEAIDAATPNSWIEIDDDGPYAELLDIPLEKDGLTILGKKGRLPVVTSAGAKNNYSETLTVHATQLRLERLAIVRGDANAAPGIAINGGLAEITFRGVVLFGHANSRSFKCQDSVFAAGIHARESLVAEDCIIYGRAMGRASSTLRNVLGGGGGAAFGPNSTLERCTINGQLRMDGASCSVKDSIVESIAANQAATTIENCDVFGAVPYLESASAGKGCIAVLPHFADPKVFDFRLLPDSPCRKAASDNTDLGFTYNAEVQTLLRAATEIRRRRATSP